MIGHTSKVHTLGSATYATIMISRDYDVLSFPLVLNLIPLLVGTPLRVLPHRIQIQNSAS
jgi:hypothetical protein